MPHLVGIRVIRHVLKDTYIDVLPDGGHGLPIQELPLRLHYLLGYLSFVDRFVQVSDYEKVFYLYFLVGVVVRV